MDAAGCALFLCIRPLYSAPQMNHLDSLSSSFVERIKVNRVWREVRDGRVFWLKRRRRSALPLLRGANLFFRLAAAPMQTLTDSIEWQRWEVNVFRGLHGADGFMAFTDGKRTIGAEEMPGINVTIPLDRGELTPEISEAVGRELRRVHEWYCPEFDAPWSHSDPHAGNFIYNPETNRARIIDFEAMHLPEAPAEQRHADDVLIFLQDVVGRIRADKWLPCAEAFLAGYDCPEIVESVRPLLKIPPRGASRLWWRVRTSFLPIQELERRLRALEELVPV